MKRQSVILSDPEILGGTACFRGTRVPVESLIDYLEAGDSLDEFLDNFPSVSREAATAALEEAKTLLTDFRSTSCPQCGADIPALAFGANGLTAHLG